MRPVHLRAMLASNGTKFFDKLGWWKEIFEDLE